MAQQVEILSLNIDTQQLIQRLAQTRQQIDQLQGSQRQLAQAGQASSQQYVQQSAQLRTLQQQYNTQLNVVTQLNAANSQATTATQAVNTALNANITSIAEATENSRQLTAIRNQLNLSTQQGRDALEAINQRLNENTEFIRSNISAQEQQRMNIGNYSDSISEALSNLNPFNGGIAGFTQRAQAAGGAGNLLSQSFTQLASGIAGATRAGLAFLATPLGAAIGALAAVIGIVVGAFKFMAASMNSTEEGSQKLSRVTATITGVFNGFWKVIKPLGEFMGGAFIKAFDLAAEAVDKAVSVISDGLRFLGFEDAADGVDNFTNEIKNSANAAAELAKAEGELDKAQRQSQLTQLKYQKEAEKLRQARDDESNSISKRIELNNQLGQVLKNQLADELAIAKQALKVAELRIKSEGRTKEALDAQAEALTEIADIEERLTGQESEQLANLNSLRKEAADAEKERREKAAQQRQKAIDDAIKKNSEEIELFIAQQGYKKKALQDELKFEEELSKKRLALLEREFKAGKISKTKYETEKLKLSEDFLKKQAEATVSEAGRELAEYKRNLEKKKADDTFFTEAKLQAKLAENNALLEKEKEYEKLRLESGIINQQEYNDAINALNDANRLRNEEAEKQRAEAKKEQEAIDLENQRILDEEKFINDFELQLNREKERYEAEKAAALKNGADLEKIEAKHTQAKKKIEDAYLQAKLQANADMFGNIASLLGENTAMGKAAAIAQATMNTFLGVSQVWASPSVLPEPFATIAKAANTGVVVASGLGAVKKITGVNIPRRADGGEIPVLQSGVINNGSNIIPLSNGDDTLAYVKQGEVILNEEQQRRAGGARFFRHIGVPGFAAGGFVGNSYSVNQMNNTKIDYDLLAEKIGDSVSKANLNLPAPITVIDDITTAQNNNSRIIQGANL